MVVMNRPSILHRQAPTAVVADTGDTSTFSDPRKVVDAPTPNRRSTGAARDDGLWPGDREPTTQNLGGDRVTRVRVSAWATLGLILGVVALCGTVTGLLAPEGFAVGVLGIVASIGGFIAAGRRPVAGRGIAVLGTLFGLAAVVLAVLAMTGTFSWPNSSTDQVSRWHTWLVAHWAWLGHWS
jgi:hypothetical protein